MSSVGQVQSDTFPILMHEADTYLLNTTQSDLGKFFLTDLYAICTDIDDVILGTVVMSVGTNSPNYNNIIPAMLLTGINDADLVARLGPASVLSPIKGVAESTDIKLKVSVPLTLGEGSLRVIMAGFYADQEF